MLTPRGLLKILPVACWIKPLANQAMTTQIRFRISGEEEQTLLKAARHSGLTPDAYARVRALAPVNPDEALPMALLQRLAAMEEMLGELSQRKVGPSAQVKGLEATDLLLAIRDECVRGVNGFLRIVDGDPLTSPLDRRAEPDKPN